MKKRILSLLIVLVLVCGLIPPVKVEAAVSYSVSKAMDYAKAHWNDGQGLCAEFVSRCVIAGGVNMSVQTGTGPCYRAIESATGLKRQDLKLNSAGYATKELNGNNLAAGDVVVQFCKTHNIAPHIIICGGYDSAGYATYYAHNGAMNNQRYKLGENLAYQHTKSCDMGGQVIRLSTLDTPAGATFSGTCTPTTSSSNTVAAFNYKVTFGGNLQSVELCYGISADNMIREFNYELQGGLSSPYVVEYRIANLEHNTTYYYQFRAKVDGKEYVDTVKSFTTPVDTSVITVKSVTECGYNITVPKDKIVFCYNSPTSRDKYRQFDFRTTEYVLFCTKRYVMSDNSVRYYCVDSNNYELYFQFHPYMRSDTVHNPVTTEEILPTCTQDGYVQSVCKCGAANIDMILPAYHSWGIWRVSVNATASAPGLKYRVCSKCSEMETEVIPAGTQLVVNPFTDVADSAYYYEPVIWAVDNGITTGTGNGTTFSPDMICTRAQVVTFLWRSAGSPMPSSSNNPFTDVADSAYYYNAVLWAVEKGITTGTGGTSFSPDMKCTRSQVVTFLWRSAGSPSVAAGSNPFSDIGTGDYFYSAVLWAVGRGITTGTGGSSFSPLMECSRGQIVTFLKRYAG